jgi:hypothetical protein
MKPYSMARPALYCREHDLPRELRERFETPRERPDQGWQCAGTTWADPVGVALPDVPKRQCAGALVSHAAMIVALAVAPYVHENDLPVEWILDTLPHADHFSAAGCV